jgi:galactokinase
MSSGEAEKRARIGFEQAFGYQPLGVWSAPGRANLIGEHTDYNLGFVLPFGIDRRTYAAIAPRQDMRVRVSSAIDGKTYEVDLTAERLPAALDWAGYPIGVAWMMREWAKSGFDCFIDSEVPVGAGLSSSAAIECSVAVALNEIWQAERTEEQLAAIGQRAENEVVGAPTGIMDQMASIKGKPDSAVLIDCRSLETQLVPLGLSEQNLVVAVIDTQVAHRHADGGYASRRAACELGAKTLGAASLRELSVDDLDRARAELDDLTFRRVRHVITENQRVLETVIALGARDLPGLGKLLLASHASMRDDFEISIEELDTAVEVAMGVGAIGARMTGGGFGGAAIAVISAEKLAELGEAVAKVFSEKGYGAPRVFAVNPSAGARRES